MKGPNNKKSENTKYYFAVGVLVIGLVALVFIAYAPLSPWSYWWEKDVETTPTTKAYSTIKSISSIDGEDVSNFDEWDIWVPKTGADFSDGMEDITALTTNFEREITGKDADDISIDLRDYDYVWAEATGNTVFDNTFYLLIGGANYDYVFYRHHRSSDVNFAILNSTMSSITIPGQSTNDNYTGVLKAPSLTMTNCHYGDIGWEITATEYTELSLREKQFLWDENNFRDQYPVYDPTVDTINEYDRDFEKITNTFALKWTLNDTISVTDGASTQVNCTIAKGYAIETLISGANLYMVWYEGIEFDEGPYTFEFEMLFGADINVTTVQSGRVDVPGSISSLTWATTYSSIGI